MKIYIPQISIHKVITTIIVFACSFSSIAQNKESILKAHEDTLINMMEEIRTAHNLKLKFELNNKFEAQLRKALRMDLAFNYEFPELKKRMSTIKSPDGTFRLFNWNIEVPETEEHYFYCLVMKFDKRKGGYITIELFDKSKYEMGDVELKVYTHKKWLGALYYKIIPVQKGAKTIYTLLGWDGNNRMSNKKIVETMAFQGSSGIKFGFPVFKIEDDKSKRRVIFQYKKQASMSLKHAVKKKKNIIIYDHLSPTSPQLEGMRDFYVPDGSYDAFIWEKGKWNYSIDVDARTGKTRNDKLYNKPE